MAHNLILKNEKYTITNLTQKEKEEVFKDLRKKGLRHRIDYMNNDISHREYYAQFVTEATKRIVLRYIGLEKLLENTCEHFSDNMPLRSWDTIPHKFNNQLALCGDWLSMAGWVCIAKEAARQIVEDYNKEKLK